MKKNKTPIFLPLAKHWDHLSISLASRPSSAQHTRNPAWKTSEAKNVHSKIVRWERLWSVFSSLKQIAHHYNT
jgi:hypothetical protein